LKAYGAELRITDPLQGSDGAILEARRLAAAEPERWAYLDQYSNPENWRSHYRTTGPVMGVGRWLRERAPAVRLISVEPDSPFHGLEGMKHMASAIVPPIYDP